MQNTNTVMKKVLLFPAIVLYLLSNAQSTMPLDSIEQFFADVKAICNKDNGDLWGINLYGPILVLHTESNTAVANEPDNEGLLKPQGKQYVGEYPDDKIKSLGITEFGGKRWTTMIYPYGTPEEFVRTTVHESFHRIQKGLGMKCSYNNRHMDEMNSRISMQLEWQALLHAIEATGENRTLAIKDALLFRQQRRALYDSSCFAENAFEIHEGLAMYTEYKLHYGSHKELKKKIVQRQEYFMYAQGSLVRRFGYYSGSLYALLLDETNILWSKGLSCESDLGLLLQNAIGIDLSKDTANWYASAISQYEYDSIYAFEQKRKEKREQKLHNATVRFTQKPVVNIPLVHANFGLKQSPYPLDSLGDVYPVIDIADNWGFIEVKEYGILYANGKAIVTAENIHIDNQLITANGWEMKLNENWTIEKEGENYRLKKIEKEE